MAQIIFRLIGNKQPQSWSLPINGATAVKPGTRQSKLINYYKGNDSIFTEDVLAENKEIKPSKLPVFYKNDVTGKTELRVNETDTNLIQLLKAHSWYGKKYEIYSLEKESENALAEYDLKLKAADLVKDLDDLELRSKAMVVFGLHAMQWQIPVANHKLKEMAFNNPKEIINKLEAKDFESQYISAQAYVEGIVKNNQGQTKVVWTDTEETILTLAVGEVGNIELGNFLNNGSDQAVNTLQAIAHKLGIDSNTTTASVSLDDSLIKEKDAEIKRLQEQITQKEADTSKDDLIAQLQAQLAEASKGGNEEIVVVPETSGDLTLEEAQAKYLDKFGKEVGPRFKNDIDWIKAELAK
ncbi:hypothetical protein AV926_17665 [Myroides marinus]|uniref:Uncharacterized protein n=1 Tax=Myroides marinus TaxID=703342 RepID=A0A165QBG8_9FLAO|nr:hypothetical protein [Myroides marinus]KZE74352.1 hypothetical protein AV926_17665 [Myroides marinus]